MTLSRRSRRRSNPKAMSAAALSSEIVLGSGAATLTTASELLGAKSEMCVFPGLAAPNSGQMLYWYWPGLNPSEGRSLTGTTPLMVEPSSLTAPVPVSVVLVWLIRLLTTPTAL